MSAICARVWAQHQQQQQQQQCRLMRSDDGPYTAYSADWFRERLQTSIVSPSSADLRPFTSRFLWCDLDARARSFSACLWSSLPPGNGLITSGSRQPLNGRRSRPICARERASYSDERVSLFWVRDAGSCRTLCERRTFLADKTVRPVHCDAAHLLCSASSLRG